MKEINLIEKQCKICDSMFTTKDNRRKFCSDKCTIESRNKYLREHFRTTRHVKNKIVKGSCQVCGFTEIVDVHREGYKLYHLCPNHHRLVTRGKRTVDSYGIEPLGTFTS